jgi:hypothetical protein
MADNECRTTTEPPLITVYLNQLLVKPVSDFLHQKILSVGLFK